MVIPLGFPTVFTWYCYDAHCIVSVVASINGISQLKCSVWFREVLLCHVLTLFVCQPYCSRAKEKYSDKITGILWPSLPSWGNILRGLQRTWFTAGYHVHLDRHNFFLQTGTSTDDAMTTTLHTSLTHLESKDTYGILWSLMHQKLSHYFTLSKASGTHPLGHVGGKILSAFNCNFPSQEFF